MSENNGHPIIKPIPAGNPFQFGVTGANYSGQGAFRFWCQTVLPIVYDDSLSYYELLNKVVDYLNKTISDISAVETQMIDLVGTDGQGGAFKSLQTEMYQQVSVMNIKANELIAWFNDLNVQDEIDNKLDEMALDGTLTAIVGASNAIPPAVAAWLGEHLTPTTPPVDNTLSISGAAADAKVTGDYISNSAENFGNVYYNSVTNYRVSSNGTVASSSSSLLYSYISLDKSRDKIIVYPNYPTRLNIKYRIIYAIKSNNDVSSTSYITGGLLDDRRNNDPFIIDYSPYKNNENLYLIISVTDLNSQELNPLTDKNTLSFRFDDSLIDQIFADKLRSPALLSNSYNIAEYFGLTKYVGWSQMISEIGASGTFVDMANNSIVVGTTENVIAFVNTEHHTFPFTLSTDHRQALIKIKGGTAGRAVYFYLIMDDDAGQPIYIGRQIHDNTYDEDYIGAWSLFSASPVNNVSTNNRAVESKYVGDKIIEYSDRMYKYVYNKFTFTDDHWLYRNGTPYSGGVTKSTDYIKVNPDEDVYFTGLPTSAYSSVLNCAGCIYDIDKKVIGWINAEELEAYEYQLPAASNAGTTPLSYIPMYKYHLPVGAEYVRLNIYHTTISQLQYYDSSYLTTLSNCACYIGEQLSNIIVYNKEAKYKDTKIAFVGASNIMIGRANRLVTDNPYSPLFYTYGSQSSRLYHYVTGFQDYLIPYCDSVTSYGYSGHDMYDVSAENKGVAHKFVELITEHPEIIENINVLVISGNTNGLDISSPTVHQGSIMITADDTIETISAKIATLAGNKYSTGYTTYCGAINEIIKAVYAINPMISIYIGNIGHRISYYTGYNYEIDFIDDDEMKAIQGAISKIVNESIYDTINYWGVSLLDSAQISQRNVYTLTNNSARHITPNTDIEAPLYTYDGIHPNTWGNKIIGEAIRKIILG